MILLYGTPRALHAILSFCQYKGGMPILLANPSRNDSGKAFMDLRDFRRMTEQDPEVWSAIFNNMENN